MLFKNSHWRFAFERNPEREARLLCMAKSAGSPDPLAPDVNNVGAGLNPDGTPQAVDTPQTDTASPEAVQEGTRNRMNDLLDEEAGATETAEQRKPLHTEAVELAREVNYIFKDIEENLHHKDVQAFIKEQPPIVQEKYDSVLRFIETEQNKIAGHLLHAETIAEWLDGNLDNPDTFFITLQDAYRGEEGGEEKVRRMRDVYEQNGAQISHWDELEETEKKRIIGALAQAGGIYQKLEHIKAVMEIYKEEAERHRNVLAIINGQHTTHMDMLKQVEGSHMKGMGLRGMLRRFYGEIGIEFYSPFEVWEAFKSIKENYVKAFKDKAQLKSAVLAKAIGGAVKFGPYGEEVNIALERDVEAKHASASKEHQESLETRNPTWIQLFENGGELDHLIHLGQRDKAVGVLEYAAKHGWLYDIDACGTVSPAKRTIIGRTLGSLCPRDWDESRIDRFYDNLRATNMSGMNSEIEDNTKKVQGIENTPFFIQEIDSNLNEGNLWAAVGVAARAIDRGLKPEVSPWVMATVMRHLRDNPIVRRHASLTFLDKIGKLAAYRSAFTTGLIQNNRPAMMKWLKSGESIRSAPDVGEILFKLEHDILDACTDGTTIDTVDKKELDRAVAYVLSANLFDEAAVEKLGFKTIRLKKGKSITIYSDRYTFYRNSNAVTDINPAHPGLGQEDTDYVFQTTENQYGGLLTYDAMLAVDGRGDFTLKDRVPEYIGQILEQYYKLTDAGLKNEAELFRWETGQKLNKILVKNALSDSRTGGTYLITLRGNNRFAGKLLLATLIDQGFFNIKDIADTIWTGQQGRQTAINILHQINPDVADKLVKAKEQKNKAEFDKILGEISIQRKFLEHKPTGTV